MEKILYPEIPVRCIISGKSNSGKSTLLSKILFNIINDFDKIYIYSPTIHQTNYQKIIKCFQSFLPLNVIDNILQADIDLEELDDVIEEIKQDEDFVSSEIEIEFYDNINEMRDANEYDSDKHNIIILDDLSKDQLNMIKKYKCYSKEDVIIIYLCLLLVMDFTNCLRILYEKIQILYTILLLIIIVMSSVSIDNYVVQT